MAIELVVTEPFKCKDNGVRYDKGAVISDPELIAAVSARYARHVIRRSRPDPKPAPVTVEPVAPAKSTKS